MVKNLLIVSFLVLTYSSSYAEVVVSKTLSNRVCDNCDYREQLMLEIPQDLFCRKEFIQGLAISCCKNIPSNKDMADEFIISLFKAYGHDIDQCHVGSELHASLYFCSGLGCVDIESGMGDRTALEEFKLANENGDCHKTSYDNIVLLNPGDSVILSASTKNSKHSSVKVSCN